MEDKLTLEMATQEFENWCEACGIDYDESSMTDEDKTSFVPLKTRIIKAIKSGQAVTDGMSIEYTLSDKYEGKMAGMVVRISEPSAKVFMGMDGYKDTQKFHQLHGAMSALTGIDVGVFAKMIISDWKFFQAVLVLFMTA